MAEVPKNTECPLCHGTGDRNGEACDNCEGRGQIPVDEQEPE